MGTFEDFCLTEQQKLSQTVVSRFLHLEIVYLKRKRKISDERAAKIKEIWNEHLKVCPNDFDGSILSLKRITVDEGKKVRLFCQPAKFSEFMVSRKEQKIGRLEIWNFHNSIDFNYPVPLSFGMMARTKPTKEHPQGCVIAAIRGETTFESGKATFLPGGYLDPTKDYKRSSGIVDLNAAILREYREELPGLQVWVKPPKLLAIVHSLAESCQPAILGWFEIPYTAEEVAEICGEKLESEIKKLIFVPADTESLRSFALKYPLCIHDAIKLVYFVENAIKQTKRY